MNELHASRSAQFPVGTQFTRIGRKHKYVETVTDVLTTYNLAGEVVAVRYVATHEFAGQVVTDSDVLGTTIARGLHASRSAQK